MQNRIKSTLKNTLYGIRFHVFESILLILLLFNSHPTVLAADTQIDIPIQPLDKALNTLARQTGARIIFSTDLTETRMAPAVKGALTPQQALERLLADSGLVWQATSDHGFTVISAQPATNQTSTLPTVTVSASVGTENQARVKADTAAVTRSGASILDTPMTVSVIPVETAIDQAAQTIGDVVRNVAGVRTTSYVGTYDALFTRGFVLSNVNNYLRNGFRYINLMQPAHHNVARYEVIKGAMSMDYGRVEPGALMNIVTKQPQAERFHEVRLGIGSRGYYEAALDVTGAVNESATMLYRFNAGTTRQAFIVDDVKPQQHDVAGALTFKLTPQTRLDLDLEYTYRKQLTYVGLPVPDPLDISSANQLLNKFYGEPEATFKGSHRLFTARLDHRFNDAWSVNFGYVNNRTMRDYTNVYFMGGVIDNKVHRYAYPGDQFMTAQTIQAQLKGDLMLMGMRHLVTVTADTSSYKERGGFPSADDSLDPVDLYDPRPTGGASLSAPYDIKVRGSKRDYGIAIQDYMSINRYLNLLAGLRYSAYSDTPTDWSGATDTVIPRQKYSNIDPTVGVVFKPQPWATIYGSYTRSSAPNVNVFTGPGQYAPPSRAQQYEVGAKAEWLDGRLRTSVAYFNLTKTNVPTASLSNPAFREISGEVNSEGWEFEAVGQLTHRWNVIAGYAYIDTEITKDNTPANVGKELSFTPHHSANLWTTYDLGGFAQDWTVGGGVYYTGSKYVNNTNLARLPAYTIIDAMIAYTFRFGLPGTRLQINLRNIFDKTHYESGSASGANFRVLYPGLPRTVLANLIVPF
ncbi:TonB-dependent siderophore receptor [Nitrosomonas europaea]|uniref:TonB-dependent siderophore receptor n=1 Tax=Nitrosomonas europaea TaxID=915 RepID=UPI003267BBAA